MPTADANGIKIEYEEFGDASGRPLLLIMGLGAQMIVWHEDFCTQLAARGHRVIRFDNRDVGKSSKFDHLEVPSLLEVITAQRLGRKIETPYSLDDMAADSVGLLDALEIESAHVVGASMGGMIAQMMALLYPSRVRSLTSIMSSTGNPDLPPAKPEAMSALLTPQSTTREGNIDRAVMVFRNICSPVFPFAEAEVRAIAAQSYDRGFCPEGPARQLVAVLASGNRKNALRSMDIPTLVIHGKDDPLVPVEAGIDTAEAIPGAELMILEGMGHDLHRMVWPRIIDAITRLTERTEPRP